MELDHRLGVTAGISTAANNDVFSASRPREKETRKQQTASIYGNRKRK